MVHLGWCAKGEPEQHQATFHGPAEHDRSQGSQLTRAGGCTCSGLALEAGPPAPQAGGSWDGVAGAGTSAVRVQHLASAPRSPAAPGRRNTYALKVRPLPTMRKRKQQKGAVSDSVRAVNPRRRRNVRVRHLFKHYNGRSQWLGTRDMEAQACLGRATSAPGAWRAPGHSIPGMRKGLKPTLPLIARRLPWGLERAKKTTLTCCRQLCKQALDCRSIFASPNQVVLP
jgi:hypothetical protein